MYTGDGQDRLFIGGKWSDPSGTERIDVVSPHTEDVVATVAAASPRDVDEAVDAAAAAVNDGPWSRAEPTERIAAIERMAAIYHQRRREMAGAISTEMGAPITFAKHAQVQLPIMQMAAFSQLAGGYDWREARPGLYGGDIVIAKRPIGVVAAIVPWNMPQFLTIGKLVPALLAGCSVIVKPAPETPLDALLLAEIIEAADLPAGVVSILPGGAEAGHALASHPGVGKISFTGSTAAGRQVARAASANLTPLSLELGGKSAAIVLDDADPSAVAKAITAASLSNSGQVCNALTRILVPASRSAEFVDALAEEFSALAVGDPADPATQIGPLVAARQQQRVLDYIRIGVDEGARLVVGGTGLPAGLERGWYVAPTLFSDADNGMRIAREEVFGPVLTVITYRDDAEAVRIANDSEYGLAGAVFTGDVERAECVAAAVHTGSFGINQGYIMDPLAPFGGVKSSGYGRELGREGFDSYLVSQSISFERPMVG